MACSRLRILVLGYIVRAPIGGMSWHYLHYVLGLHRLGHDVTFLEDSDDFESCYDPSRHVTDADPTYGLAYTKDAFDRLGLADRWAYYDAHTDTWHGPAGPRAVSISEAADVLINVSGSNPIRPWLAGVPHRIFIDTDPVFEQVRQLTVPERRALGDCHNAFFTFGENIALGTSEVPDDGRSWRATRQPIDLEGWPALEGPGTGAFTTVMQWDSYPAREFEGIRYGMKSESFEPYAELPRRVDAELEIALGSPNAPANRLQSAGWRIVNPLEVTRTPWSYRDYIQASAGEFTVAKHGYVRARTGWFSERSAAYLASGRPVVVQDTGFSGHLPVGEGLLTFSTPEEAAEAIERVEADYAIHAVAARKVAANCFEAGAVLTSLIERL